MTNNSAYSPGCDIVASMVDGAKVEIKRFIASSSGDFTLDLTGVEMIDSKGIGLVIATYNTLEAAGRKLHIVGAIPDIVELFRVMRLDRHFDIA
jgi:anti-anti-sigma factor